MVVMSVVSGRYCSLEPKLLCMYVQKQLAGAMGVYFRIFIEAVAVYCQSTQEVRLVRFNSAH